VTPRRRPRHRQTLRLRNPLRTPAGERHPQNPSVVVAVLDVVEPPAINRLPSPEAVSWSITSCRHGTTTLTALCSSSRMDSRGIYTSDYGLRLYTA
jgi:hypothetical protein